MKPVAIATVLALAAASFGPARAETVTASGCVAKGVENGCLMLSSGDKTYNITSAKPTPKVGTYGTVSGTVSEQASICQQGTLLSPATWKGKGSKKCGDK